LVGARVEGWRLARGGQRWGGLLLLCFFLGGVFRNSERVGLLAGKTNFSSLRRRKDRHDI